MAVIDSKNLLVGAGGWQDYFGPRHAKLKAYSREFEFVETNSTFYRVIHPKTFELWRRSVPSDFEFSVKCYKALTHKVGIRPVEDAFRVFAVMQKCCDILKSKILVMQTPPSLKLDDKFVDNARSFFKSTKLGRLRIAFELRVTPARVPDNVVHMLQDFGMVHTVDLTFEDTRLESDLLYTRVFGSPIKQNRLDSDDLKVLKKKVEKSKASDVRIVGHSLKMIEDTRRIKETLRTPSP